LLVLIAAALVVLVACSRGEEPLPPAVATDSVMIKDMQFSPRAITVPAGTTVTWTFADGNVSHDVRGTEFQSPVQREGTFSHRFDAPGRYDYLCTLHPQMRGRVTVINEQQGASDSVYDRHRSANRPSSRPVRAGLREGITIGNIVVERDVADEARHHKDAQEGTPTSKSVPVIAHLRSENAG
jgi:plastocyanin